MLSIYLLLIGTFVIVSLFVLPGIIEDYRNNKK